MMKKESFLALTFIVMSVFSACNTANENTAKNQNIDWQGHRGARGVYPENTWKAFEYALKKDMTTLEMDVVITQDLKVVVSHEPFLNHKICQDSTGNTITEEDEKQYNIYEMRYQELIQFDCGTIQNPDFKEQKPFSSPKPLLVEVVEKTKSYCKESSQTLPHLNVEIKYEAENAGKYHPDIKTFSDLVYNVLTENYPADKWNIQSFDFDVLKYFNTQYPAVPLAALVYENGNYEKHFESLGFKPEIYSPYYQLVDKKMVDALHQHDIKVIPWTVNKDTVAARLIRLGVDGIITDYPAIADSFRNNQ